MFSQNLWQHCIKKRLDSSLRGKQKYNCLVLLFLLIDGLVYCIFLLSHSAGSIVWSEWIIKCVKTESAFLFVLLDYMFISLF